MNLHTPTSFTQEDVIKAEQQHFSQRMSESFGEMLIQKYGQEMTQRILQPEYIEDTMRLLLCNFQHNLIQSANTQGMSHIGELLRRYHTA